MSGVPIQDIDALQSVLGHEFSNRALLEQALVHGSLATEESGPNNETLEFLGDAVINLVVSEGLMATHPAYNEGRLSRGRAAIVSARGLADVAEELEIGRFIRLGKGEEISGGRLKTSILASCYEAVVGAVFLDGGYAAARAVVLRHMNARLAAGGSDADHKTRLQEIVQARYRVTPTYRMLRVSGPHHARKYHCVVEFNDEVLGEGEGPSRKDAEQRAAREALVRLEQTTDE
jgi:ribonuclease-3